MRPGDNPLAKFSDLIDQPMLLEAVFEKERKTARQHLEKVLTRLVRLIERDLESVALDWLFSPDERLLEPYAWLIEVLDTLNKLPSQCDALCHSSTHSDLEKSINRLTLALLQAKHPLTRRMLTDSNGALPDTVKRLKTLQATAAEPALTHMGLSSLLHGSPHDSGAVDALFIYTGMTGLISDLMDTFATAVATQLNRLSGSLVNIELSRLFAPAFGVFSHLSPSWEGLKLIPKNTAIGQDWVILGVEGAGLRYGLTVTERRTLTQKHYRYASLHDQVGNPIGSTSPRHASREQSNLGRMTVVAAPADHPQVQKLSAWKLQANRSVKVTMKTPAVPLVAVVCAMFNLQTQYTEMSRLKSEVGDGYAKYRGDTIGAAVDLIVALGNLTKPVLGTKSSLVNFLNKPRFDVSKISTRWAANLYEQTGSTKLPFLRLVSGWAMMATTGLSIWDAKRAWHQGDHDASLVYGLAAAGGAAWTAYALGMSINPFVLVVGGVLFIGGSVLASWLVDSDIEALLKNAPFGCHHGQVGLLDELLGEDKRFVHLHNPHTAYTQFIGILGKPVVRVARLADWREQAAPAQLDLIQSIENERRVSTQNSLGSCVNPALQAFDDNDWVLTLHSPLLAMFGGERDFQLFAEEQLSVLPLSEGFNVERVERRGVGAPKLSALALDESTVLYILPSPFGKQRLTPVQRQHFKVTQRLKISAQFHLSQADNTRDALALALPQPTPKRWQAYNPAFRRPPSPSAQSGEAPYWHIETSEFKV